MSGIVGSRLNIRGSGVVGGLGTDGQILTSSGAGQEIVFETATASGVTAINNATANELVTVGSTTTELDAESGLTYTDGALVIGGTTPSLTIGDAGAEDTKIVFDGNAQDFHIGLDDTADDLVIGLGSSLGTTPAIEIDENLKVNISVTTASTSASTGSLTTGGGAGIGADLYVGDDTYLITDSAVLGFGADKDTTLTHTDGTGLTLNSTNKLCFNDASQFIQGSSNAILSLGATDEIDLTATAVDLNGTLDVSGATTTAAVTASGIVKTDDTTEATSTTDGSLQTDGGLSVAKDTVLGDDLKLLSDSSVIAFGADGDTTLTHTDGTGLTLNSTNKICFNDTSQFIQGSSNAILSLGATDEIDLTATAVDLNGTLNVSGVATFQATPVFPDGSLALADLDIDGGTEIGAAIVDADLFIIDDGAGGTNRKCLASRLKTYAGGGDLSFGGDAFGADKQIGSTDNYDLDFIAGNASKLLLRWEGQVLTGGETAHDATPGSLGLQSAAGDGVMFGMKSTDVAHPFTTGGIQAEADSWGIMRKKTYTGGGLYIYGLGDSDSSGEGLLEITAFTVNALSTAKNGGTVGNIMLKVSETDDSDNVTNTSATSGNLLSISDHTSVSFIFDKEGDFFAHGSTDNTYDKYDDAQLVRALDLSRGEGKGIIESKFDKFVAYNHENLAEMNLVGRENDGTPNHFINVCGFQRLHNGAIWQQYEKHNQLLEAVYELGKEAIGEEKANAILEKHEVKRLQ